MSDLAQVTRLPPQGMITLRGTLDALPEAVGPVPAPLQKAGETLWMSPDELLILSDYAQAEARVQDLEAALAGSHALVVNVSDARVMFEVHGAALRDVLAKLTPADVSPEGLPVGMVRRTRLAQVAAAFWLEEETRARVICFRSVATYAEELLRGAAQAGGAVGMLAR